MSTLLPSSGKYRSGSSVTGVLDRWTVAAGLGGWTDRCCPLSVPPAVGPPVLPVLWLCLGVLLGLRLLCQLSPRSLRFSEPECLLVPDKP